MEEKKIQEGNKLIAETVGEKIDLNKFGENWKKVISQHNKISEIPCYHSSWDWFVPAFNKIQKMKHDKDFCDLISSYIRFDDHENAFKCLINYIDLVVHNNPIKVNMEALKDLKKYL